MLCLQTNANSRVSTRQSNVDLVPSSTCNDVFVLRVTESHFRVRFEKDTLRTHRTSFAIKTSTNHVLGFVWRERDWAHIFDLAGTDQSKWASPFRSVDRQSWYATKEGFFSATHFAFIKSILTEDSPAVVESFTGTSPCSFPTSKKPYSFTIQKYAPHPEPQHITVDEATGNESQQNGGSQPTYIRCCRQRSQYEAWRNLQLQSHANTITQQHTVRWLQISVINIDTIPTWRCFANVWLGSIRWCYWALYIITIQWYERPFSKLEELLFLIIGDRNKSNFVCMNQMSLWLCFCNDCSY